MGNSVKIIKELSQIEISAIKSSWMVTNDGVLRWKRKPNKGNIGDVVGVSTRPSGHENVCLYLNKKTKLFVLARIVWFLRTGEYPQAEIEHKNCNPKDNSIENLRLATRSQNLANTRRGGVKKGIYLDNRVNKWYTQVQCNGKVYNKSGFSSFEDAYKYRQIKAKELFGEFARQG
jgi:hypothetical protein